MSEPSPSSITIYQLRVVLWGVSPLVWRRLLLASDTSIAELHEILKSAFDWSGEHLHRFLIHGSTRAWFPAQPEHGILRVRAAQGFQPPRGKENRRWYGVAAIASAEYESESKGEGFPGFYVTRLLHHRVCPPLALGGSFRKFRAHLNSIRIQFAKFLLRGASPG